MQLEVDADGPRPWVTSARLPPTTDVIELACVVARRGASRSVPPDRDVPRQLVSAWTTIDPGRTVVDLWVHGPDLGAHASTSLDGRPAFAAGVLVVDPGVPDIGDASWRRF